jgi:hypothetical protein
MKYLKTFESYKVNEMVPGSMGAIAGGQYKSQKPTEEEASDKPDEFLCHGLVSPMMKKWGSYNCKLVDCEVYLAEEKKGFFSKLFADSTTMVFKLESELLNQPVEMSFKLKGDKFVRIGKASSDKVVYGYVAEEHQEKFIKYVLGQSKWAKEFKEEMPGIDKQFTKESFE